MPSLLVTGPVDARQGERIRALAGPALAVRVLGDEPLSDAELADIHAAFLSLDLMGAGSKAGPSAMKRFGAAVDAAPSLRWLHTCASGSDRPVLQRLMKRGVTVTTSTGANAKAVANAALAGLLALERDVPAWVRAQQARTWLAPGAGAIVPSDLDGAHAVIVGAGAIGRALAASCRALGMRVTGVRRHDIADAAFDAVVTSDGLADVVADASWLVLACPLTPATRGLLDARLLARLPAHARVANVGRGELVVEDDLFDAVRQGRIAGLYADVFTTEPLPADSPWWTLPRTLVSPHVGGLSRGYAARTEAMFLENLRRWLQGQPLDHVAQPAQEG